VDVERALVDILNAYEGGQPLISCQGQAMDGYSALHNFVELARKVRAARLDTKDGQAHPPTNASQNAVGSSD